MPKFIALNQARAAVPTIIQVNEDHITCFRITAMPDTSAATRIDLISGESIFVTETPTDILRLIDAAAEKSSERKMREAL